MSAYYNEIDPLKAEVLREAIRAGAIAAGDVDERSIADVEPDDLLGYAQCHFFAGGGFWSLALRWAGWPDDRPVWTGSCPCPSFSAAGKGGGFDDPRHLWPHWFRLARKRRPAVLFGEQVAAAIGHGWLDLVQADLEAEAYSVGKMVFGACSVGAGHIRQRLYFVADTAGGGRIWRRTGEAIRESRAQQQPERCGDALDLGDAASRGFREHGSAPGNAGHADIAGTAHGLEHAIREGLEGHDRHGGDGDQPGRIRTLEAGPAAAAGESGELGDPHSESERRLAGSEGATPRNSEREMGQRDWQWNGYVDDRAGAAIESAGPLNGFWRDADWIGCRDGKFRPVEPGTFPLAHGSTARVGRLRLYGDGIVVTAAQAFIESYLEVKP